MEQVPVDTIGHRDRRVGHCGGRAAGYDSSVNVGVDVSIGVQSGPPIGVQKGPLCCGADRLMLGAVFALLAT